MECFQDSTRENQARKELETLTLRFPYIDKFTSKFEELARQANYTAMNPETRQMFLKGLPQNILEDIVKAGTPPTYANLKQKTIEAVRAQQTIDNIVKWKSGTTLTPNNNYQPGGQRN